MQKILILNGSPKCERSSTMAVTEAFVRGIESCSNFNSEILHISKLNVKPCLDCLGCWGHNKGECCIKDDDVSMVKQKILEADIIILSFPLFFFGLPGEMKILMDRLLSFLMPYRGQRHLAGKPFHDFRYDMSGKEWVLISGSAWDDFQVFKPIEQQFNCILGEGGYTLIRCPQIKAIVDQGMRIRLLRYLQRYENAGKEFGNKGRLSETTMSILNRPPFSKSVYSQILENFWQQEKIEFFASSSS